MATRSVTITGHRLGVSLKLGVAATVLVLIALPRAVPPLLLAGVLAVILAALVIPERRCFPCLNPRR